MNRIDSFKNREIDLNKPVYVYRNLNKKGVWYSLKQNNQVKAHAQELKLFESNFIVNEKSRDKIRITGKKFPHAYIKGYLTEEVPNDILTEPVRYNPKQVDGFINIERNEPIKKATWVICSEYGVFSSVSINES